MGVMKDDRVGSVDGTHVYARVPTNISAGFPGRKHCSTQNVVVVVDLVLGLWCYKKWAAPC
jgi:hypothetical protein